MSAIVDKLIKRFGTQENVAAIAGVAQPTVAGWKKSGVVPSRHQRTLLVAGQKLTPPLTAEELIGAVEPSEEAAQREVAA